MRTNTLGEVRLCEEVQVHFKFSFNKNEWTTQEKGSQLIFIKKPIIKKIGNFPQVYGFRELCQCWKYLCWQALILGIWLYLAGLVSPAKSDDVWITLITIISRLCLAQWPIKYTMIIFFQRPGFCAVSEPKSSLFILDLGFNVLSMGGCSHFMKIVSTS